MLYSYKLCNVLDIGRYMQWERAEERIGMGRNREIWQVGLARLVSSRLVIHAAGIKCPCILDSNVHHP